MVSAEVAGSMTHNISIRPVGILILPQTVAGLPDEGAAAAFSAALTAIAKGDRPEPAPVATIDARLADTAPVVAEGEDAAVEDAAAALPPIAVPVPFPAMLRSSIILPATAADSAIKTDLPYAEVRPASVPPFDLAKVAVPEGVDIEGPGTAAVPLYHAAFAAIPDRPAAPSQNVPGPESVAPRNARDMPRADPAMVPVPTVYPEDGSADQRVPGRTETRAPQPVEREAAQPPVVEMPGGSLSHHNTPAVARQVPADAPAAGVAVAAKSLALPSDPAPVARPPSHETAAGGLDVAEGYAVLSSQGEKAVAPVQDWHSVAPPPARLHPTIAQQEFELRFLTARQNSMAFDEQDLTQPDAQPSVRDAGSGAKPVIAVPSGTVAAPFVPDDAWVKTGNAPTDHVAPEGSAALAASPLLQSLAGDGTRTAPTVPMAALPQLIAQAARTAQAQSVDVKLDPVELGTIAFNMETGPAGLVVSIVVERPETLDLMRRHADQFLADLRQSGFQGASLNFSQSGQFGQSGPFHQSGQDQQPHHRPGASADPQFPTIVEPQSGAKPQKAGGGLDLRL